MACQFQPNPSQSVWHHPRALIFLKYIFVRILADILAVWKHCSTSYSMPLCIFTLNLISRSSYLKEALWSPPESEPTAHWKETRCQPSEIPNLTRCAPKRNASCTQMERTAHRNETRCAPEWNTLLTLVKPQAETRRAWKTKRAANLAKPPNRTHCAESETNRTRCAESETNRTTYPLETRGTKRATYLT